ncbi:MAG: hypothetical protein MZV70_60300 [Desulfobacterales bacterium]|nr:hypothetical protein [Desulfobacterales bacterium]
MAVAEAFSGIPKRTVTFLRALPARIRRLILLSSFGGSDRVRRSNLSNSYYCDRFLLATATGARPFLLACKIDRANPEAQRPYGRLDKAAIFQDQGESFAAGKSQDALGQAGIGGPVPRGQPPGQGDEFFQINAMEPFHGEAPGQGEFQDDGAAARFQYPAHLAQAFFQVGEITHPESRP